MRKRLLNLVEVGSYTVNGIASLRKCHGQLIE